MYGTSVPFNRNILQEKIRTVNTTVLKLFVNFNLVNHVGQEGHLTGSLDGLSELTLMHGAGAGCTAGQDLAALGHVAAELSSIFVVDKSALIGTELANFSALVVLCIVLIKSQGCILL